ncbi:amidase signature domain protein [Triangularia verruculosa]|uniref:Amidase signature domain protein n=1 Tax=Triangularia verruculosa TaxID=2587418 RepID=A0AAN7B050_9PEZI|nr:amidase signature domain protein [Triangularia verruculosa]
MASSSVQVLARGEYFVHPQEVGRLVGAATSEGSEFWTPAVLLSVKDSSFGLEHARAALDDFALQDDVFCDDFTSTVILQHDEAIDIAAVASRLAESGCFQTILFKNNETTPLFGFLPQGPYFVHAKSINQAWKLYEDSLNAFVIPTVADDVVNPTSFSALQAVSQHAIFKSIAVPSRLYASPSKEKPLAGVRVSIKDNYDLKGIRTTMMNRAYNEIYPPCTSSAAYVTKLTQLGAIIVGKTKMSPFASAAELTDQWIVCPCPFNPRGDEYQFPSCSSTGAGASLAGYPWLDHSIGSDTSGSIRLPAAFNGLFGLRTSYVGTLHRSLEDAKHLIKATLDVPDSSQFPKRLLYPLNFFPQADTEQQAMTEEFITIVEEFIGVQRTPISITDIWASSPPEEAGGKPLLEMSAVWPMYYDTYHTFDDFRSEYLEKFGTPAYVGPYMQTWWGIAVSFTEEERAQGVAEMKVFRTWFEKHIMGLDKDSVTDAVMIMPFGSAAPKYRDDPNKLPSIVGSFSVFYLPAVLQTPVLIVPIGQKPYDSRISGKKEYLPIVSSLMGAKGSDVLLLNLAEAVLKRAGWPTKVKTGREMFAVGDNVRNVLDGDIEYMG